MERFPGWRCSASSILTLVKLAEICSHAFTAYWMPNFLDQVGSRGWFRPEDICRITCVTSRTVHKRESMDLLCFIFPFHGNLWDHGFLWCSLDPWVMVWSRALHLQTIDLLWICFSNTQTFIVLSHWDYFKVIWLPRPIVTSEGSYLLHSLENLNLIELRSNWSYFVDIISLPY